MSEVNEQIPAPLPRIAHFEEMGYGLFLHWGLYSQMGAGEWIMHIKPVPKETYRKLFDSFTAEGFDARAWAKLAKDAGMRYACLTTRHHDGFSLYDTRGLSDYDAPHSPAKRDLVMEFVEACRAEGIVPFFYHTTLDWSFDSHSCSPKAFDAYMDYLIKSVDILCTRYGEIGGYWFDGNWSRNDVDWREDELYGVIRQKQPQAIISNNSGLGARGAVGHPELDTITFEQGLPSAPDRRGWKKYLAGEMSQTMNQHWGVGANDFRYKSVPEVIETLCACRKVGATYLLNVGPLADGSMPELEAATLRRAGQWLSFAGDALYKGKPYEAQCQGKDFILQMDGDLYHFTHNLGIVGDQNVTTDAGGGAGPRAIKGISGEIKSITWVDNDETLRFSHNSAEQLTTFDATPYSYGHELIVRVAKIELA